MTDRRAPDLTAKDVMTEEVLTVQPDWPIEQLADFLVRNEISGAPVASEAGELIGVVSLTDVARANIPTDRDLGESVRHEYYFRVFDEPRSAEEEAGEEGEHADLKVQEIMTPMVLDVDEDTPVPDVAAKMLETRVHRLFVTRKNRVCGVITAFDLLEVIAAPE